MTYHSKSTNIKLKFIINLDSKNYFNSNFSNLSALTSGCEVAFFSLDKSIIPDDNSNKLIKKLSSFKKPKRLLATILISNNFINIAIVILFASIDNPF